MKFLLKQRDSLERSQWPCTAGPLHAGSTASVTVDTDAAGARAEHAAVGVADSLDTDLAKGRAARSRAHTVDGYVGAGWRGWLPLNCPRTPTPESDLPSTPTPPLNPNNAVPTTLL